MREAGFAEDLPLEIIIIVTIIIVTKCQYDAAVGLIIIDAPGSYGVMVLAL